MRKKSGFPIQHFIFNYSTLHCPYYTFSDYIVFTATVAMLLFYVVTVEEEDHVKAVRAREEEQMENSSVMPEHSNRGLPRVTTGQLAICSGPTMSDERLTNPSNALVLPGSSCEY